MKLATSLPSGRLDADVLTRTPCNKLDPKQLEVVRAELRASKDFKALVARLVDGVPETP